jgi:hypothetical protein
MWWMVLFAEIAEVKQMYVAYLREDATYNYQIIDRRTRLHLSLLFPDESLWIVPGTVGADD